MTSNLLSNNFLGVDQEKDQLPPKAFTIGVIMWCLNIHVLTVLVCGREKLGNIREIKFDVTWSYVKRQTAKMTSEFVFFSSNPPLNHIKIEKCLLPIATNTNIHSTVQRAKDRRQKFHFCRLPFHVRPHNVKLNLPNDSRYTWIYFCVAKHVRWLHYLRKHDPRTRLARYIVSARNRRCFHNHMPTLDLGGILCK